MKRILDEILEANLRFVESEEWKNYPNVGGKPTRKIAIFTCMDSRLTEFIVPALGLQRGDAKIIKNAGNTIVDNQDGSVIRSLVVAVYELGVEEVIVVGHFDCGMSKINADNLLHRMLERGVTEEAIQSIDRDLREWVGGFSSLADNLREVCIKIRTCPLLPRDLPVHGLLIHPLTGMIQVIVNGYQYIDEWEK